MKKDYLNKITPGLVLLVFAILSYWQASFMVWTFKWDMLDVVLPWRYHIGECLQNGVFPFWNPYQQTGYPIHADLQCPVWYPVVWIVGSITGYNIYVLQILFVLNIFIAGYGMYILAFFFNRKKTESLIIGTTYMLSGFFVAHGQHFFALIGAAYIPYVIYFYLKLAKQPNFVNTCKLSFFTFLLISGGYQTLTILTGYLLLILFVFILIRLIREGRTLYSFLRYNFLFALLILVLCSPIIISLFQLSEFSNRFSQGVTLKELMKFPFSPQSLISLLFPFATTSGDFFNTDISMRNIYFGILGLLFLVFAPFKKKRSIEWLFLGFGLICLLASLGDYTPVRKFLADYFPLMNQFKTPSYLTLFFIISILISISIHITDILKSIQSSRKKVFLVTGVVVFIICAANLVSYLKTGSNIRDSIHTGNITTVAANLTFFDRIFIQSIFHLAFLFLFILLVYNASGKKQLKRILLLIVFLDLFVSTNLNSYFSTFLEFSPTSLHTTITKHPKGFPVPHNEKVAEATDRTMAEYPLWRNLGNFQKRISFDGFTSLAFSNYLYLLGEQSTLKDSILSNTVVYFSDRVLPFDSISKKQTYSSNDLFVENHTYEKIKLIPIQKSKNDTIIIEKYNPIRVELTAENQCTTVLTFLQQYYTGWKIYIDGEQREIFTSNSLYMSCIVEPGRHTVVIKYSNGIVLSAAILSALVFCLLLLFLSVFLLKTKNSKAIWPTLTVSLFLIAILLFCYRSANKENNGTEINRFNNTLAKIIKSYPQDSLSILLNTDLRIKKIEEEYSTQYFRFKIPAELNEFSDHIDKLTTPILIYGRLNAYEPPAIKYTILDRYPCISESHTQKGNSIVVYRRDKLCNPFKHFLEVENSFEEFSDTWGATEKNMDSSVAMHGKFSYRLDSTVKYSPTYSGTYKELGINKPGSATLDISLFVYLTENSNPSVVFENQSKRKGNTWKGYNIRKLKNINNEWIKVRFSFTISSEYNNSDSFKIFIWDQNGSACYLDQLKIRFDAS